MPYRISIIGAGSWGTTLGNLLAEKGYDVKIWAFEKETAKNINETHENPQFLHDLKLSEELIAYNLSMLVRRQTNGKSRERCT